MLCLSFSVLGMFAALSPGDCSVDGPPRGGEVVVSPAAQESLDWLSARGYQLDVAAYGGLPPRILQQDLEYLKAAADIVGGDNVARRDAHHLLNRDERSPDQPLEGHPGAFKSGMIYPYGTWVEDAGEEAIPLQLLPDPAVVRRNLLNSPENHARTAQQLIDAGEPYNRTILFQPGPASEDPNYPRWPAQPYYFSSLELGRLVGRDAELAAPLEQLRMGQGDGATLLATMTSVALSDAVYLVEIEQNDRSETLIAYPIAKGHSGRREPAAMHDRVIAFANQVVSQQDATINGHTTAIAPRPLTQSERASAKPWLAEDVVVYETHARNVPPVVVLRKHEHWEPFQEDYILDASLELAAGEEHAARRIGLFMNIQPQALLQVVAVLHDEDAAAIAENAAAIESLQRLRHLQLNGNAATHPHRK